MVRLPAREFLSFETERLFPDLECLEDLLPLELSFSFRPDSNHLVEILALSLLPRFAFVTETTLVLCGPLLVGIRSQQGR